MTSMDDGLLSSRNTTRRGPSQRILADMDGTSRWMALRSRPWSVAFALVAPCALVALSVFLAPNPSSQITPVAEEIPEIGLPSLVDAALLIPPFHRIERAATPAIAAARVEPQRSTTHLAQPKLALAKTRRGITSPSADIAVLSVLVEHIDAERRRALRGEQADRRRPAK